MYPWEQRFCDKHKFKRLSKASTVGNRFNEGRQKVPNSIFSTKKFQSNFWECMVIILLPNLTFGKRYFVIVTSFNKLRKLTGNIRSTHWPPCLLARISIPSCKFL